MKTKILKRLNRIILYFSLTSVMVFFLFPFYWIFITSFESKANLYKKTLSFIPRNFTFDNYISILGGGNISIVKALESSIVISILTIIICLILGIFSAYAFARLKFKGSNIFFIALIITEMIPPVTPLIPLFLMFRKLNLINNIWGLVIYDTSWILPIVTWILYSYFRTIPLDLEEAARIDGASRIGALFRVIIPVSFPGIISSAVICLIFSMGELMGAIAIMIKQSAETVPLALAHFIDKYQIDYGRITAGGVLSILLPILFVLIFQRFLVSGLTAGALKE